MVMINQFDLIGDTDIDDPLQIALKQIEIVSQKAAAAAKTAKDAKDTKAAAAAADADPELLVEETQKGALPLPEDGVPYQDRRGQNGRRRGPGRNFESNWNVDDFSAVPEDSSQDLLGKPSIRGYSDQPYRGRVGGGRGRGYLNRDNGEYDGRGYLNRDNGQYAGRGYLNRDNGQYAGRGYLNRDNGEYAGRPAHRQYERQSGISSPPAKVKGELSPLVKDVPAPHVELETTDKLPEQNLEENVTSEGKSSNPELDNAPTSNALNKNKKGMANGREEKAPEVKVMTLKEYQKVLEGRDRDRVAKLMLIKTTQERKVDVEKEFESMQQLVDKKENNEFFIKLGNDKEAGKRKEDIVGDERVKKDIVGDERVKKDIVGDERVKKDIVGVERLKKDIIGVERVKKVFRKFEFLRPAEGGQGVRGGRGGQGWRGGQGGLGGQDERGVQGERGGQGWRGGQGGRGVQGGRGGRSYSSSFSDESIKDPRQFPVLGGKEVEQHSSAQGKKVEQQQHSPAAQGRK